MSTINIPSTVEEALASLTGIGRLVTAKEWERAAIVYALVGPSPGPGRPVIARNGAITVSDLADKGIVGLTKRDTVARYRDAWQAQIDKGLIDVTGLGWEIEFDDDDADWVWPPDEVHRRLDNGDRRAAVETQAQADGVSQSSAIRVAESPKAMQAAIKADPATARAAQEALSEARMKAEDPTYPQRHAQAQRDGELNSADAAQSVAWAKRQRDLLFIKISLTEWAKTGDVDAIDQVSLMLDEVRGDITVQANALTPEMFAEGSQQ